MRIPAFIFIQLEKKSHRPVLPEGSRSPPGPQQPKESAGSQRGRLTKQCTHGKALWVQPQSAHLWRRKKQLQERALPSHCWQPSFCTCSKPENYLFWIIIIFFFPKNIKREDCACFHMNVTICSWARHSKLHVWTSVPLPCGSPFALLTHLTEVDASACTLTWLMYLFVMCNQYSGAELSPRYSTFFIPWEATTLPSILKVGIERK